MSFEFFSIAAPPPDFYSECEARPHSSRLTTNLRPVPFAWYGGWAGFRAWLANAEENAAFYRCKGAWGIVPVDRTVRVLLGMSGRDAFDWPTLGLDRAVNVAAGIACFVAALPRSRDVFSTLLLFCGAILLIPGNAHFYTALYLFAPFAVWLSVPPTANSPTRQLANSLTILFWFLIFSPLQIPFGPGCLNHPLANIAFVSLVLLAFWKERTSRGR